jgi:uncharacterized protein (DUF934 family)
MALLEAGRIVADTWTAVEDDAPLPKGPAIVSLARLRAEAPALLAHFAPLGVDLPNDADPAELEGALHRVDLVVLHFPKPRDGRAFTQARQLRERFRFAGGIRAVGHVLPDLYLFMLRCGINGVEVPDDADVDVWTRAGAVIPTAYQAAATGDAPLGLLRRRIALG